ncbi:prostate androgen-regulated mucin-like protein 1 [Dendropsophus ebraccatus]|uniref:prostate androgen-regulated mucin-like protein 1 n=1 Tax=Dendropsophus ebraccatus TaxID=150705 RepID=UPI003831F8D6
MDVKRSAGSPLLLLLLLTGLHVKVQSTEVSSQSTQDTSLPPTPTSTGLAASKEDTSTATSSGTLVLTDPSDQQKTNTTTVQSNRNDTGNATTTITVSPFSRSNNSPDPTATTETHLSDSTLTTANHSSDSTPTTANHSSDSTPTTANSTNTPGVSSNTIISTSATISINTTSGPYTPFPFNHTNGPTQNNTGTSPKVNETGQVSIAPTESTPSSTKGVTSPSKPALPDTSASSGTKASPNTDPTVGAEQTDATKNQGTSTTHVGTDHQVELSRALSPGSVAAITIIVIVLVLLIFGGAAFWKIRHSSYGRLLEDQDYGSLGNYNNPLYDDS